MPASSLFQNWRELIFASEIIYNKGFMQAEKELLERILKELELLHEKSDELLSRREDVEIKLLDNQDLCQLLHVDKRTLQRYRSNGILQYTRIGGKTFYTPESIRDLIEYRKKRY